MRGGKAGGSIGSNFPLPHRDYSAKEAWTADDGDGDGGEPNLLCVWMPVTDATLDSGCLYVLPRGADKCWNDPTHPVRDAARHHAHTHPAPPFPSPGVTSPFFIFCDVSLHFIFFPLFNATAIPPNPLPNPHPPNSPPAPRFHVTNRIICAPRRLSPGAARRFTSRWRALDLCRRRRVPCARGPVTPSTGRGDHRAGAVCVHSAPHVDTINPPSHSSCVIVHHQSKSARNDFTSSLEYSE